MTRWLVLALLLGGCGQKAIDDPMADKIWIEFDSVQHAVDAASLLGGKARGLTVCLGNPLFESQRDEVWMGAHIAIDDFGTGLASHNYLRELPVDYVKIDGSFITGIHKNRNDYAIARSINDLAHFLGQETIAESVENDAIIAKLREIGVDYLQGWGVGRPKLLAEVAEDLSTIEK